MPSISSDQIRDISIKTVEGFLNDKIPLSEGLAKQASLLQLNSEQIQRSVEATNSIAYLKVLSLTDDRTMEFPLCKYAEVMVKVALPDTDTVFVKKASAVGKSSPEVFTNLIMTDAEQRVTFIKQAALNEAHLTKLKDRSFTILPELTKAASIVKADKQGLEKLATISRFENFDVLSVMVYGTKQIFNDSGLFKQAELKEVLKLSDLYKEAKLLQVSISEKQSLSDRSSLVKKAFVEGTGNVAGKAIGGVVTAPFKALGKGIANTTHNLGVPMANAAKSKLGMKTSPFIKRVGIGALALPAIGIGFDASMYTPGVNADTGTSKDAWTALQRQ